MSRRSNTVVNGIVVSTEKYVDPLLDDSGIQLNLETEEKEELNNLIS